MAAPFISSGRTHSQPSRVPRDSGIGTDFRKSSCNYTKFQVASINNKKVIRRGAGPTQSGINIGVTREMWSLFAKGVQSLCDGTDTC